MDGRTSTPVQSLDTRIGTLAFTHDFANGYPTRQTIETLYDERDFHVPVRRTSGCCR